MSYDENRATERGFRRLKPISGAAETIHNKSSTTDAQIKGQNMLNEIIPVNRQFCNPHYRRQG